MHAYVCVFSCLLLCRLFNSKFGLLVYELNSVSIPLESMNILFFFLYLRFFLHTKVTIDYSKKHVFAVLSPAPACNLELHT